MMGDGATDTEYAFSCPECAESLRVNEAMQAVLLERGCVICGAAVTPDDFSDPDADD